MRENNKKHTKIIKEKMKDVEDQFRQSASKNSREETEGRKFSKITQDRTSQARERLIQKDVPSGCSREQTQHSSQ